MYKLAEESVKGGKSLPKECMATGGRDRSLEMNNKILRFPTTLGCLKIDYKYRLYDKHTPLRFDEQLY